MGTKVPGDPVCAAAGCTKELCCVCLTTTPCTTTTHLTCSSFTCPAGWVKRPQAYNLQGTLSAELCCARLTTPPAPASPCTTAAPASPCTTHAMRLYSAGEEGVVQKSLAVKQNSATSKVSFSMVLPMFALFSVGGVAVAVVIRKAARGRTGHVRLVESPADE